MPTSFAAVPPQRMSHSAGAIAYTEERRKVQTRYQEAVKRAGFLNKRERENWGLLGHLLSEKQLAEAEQVIINEDLRRLRVQSSLEKIKPIKQNGS